MGWDAYLYDDRGHCEGEWNFTHNTSFMIYEALENAGYILPDSTRPCWSLPKDPETDRLTYYPNGRGTLSWWDELDGMSGAMGRLYLSIIVIYMERHPELAERNPENGWGSYAHLLQILKEMRDRVPDYPSYWSASG